MKLGSLFDGIGGFPLAGTRHGFEPVWASEIEPFPIRVTQTRFPQMKHHGDNTKLDGAEIEPVDLICGGSPCQDLSVAGKREGLAGARSGLYMEQIRVIKEMRDASIRNIGMHHTEDWNGSNVYVESTKRGVCGDSAGRAGSKNESGEADATTQRSDRHVRPRFMVWENVPGAFSSNKGEDFRAVIEEAARVADSNAVIPGPPKGKWANAGAVMGNGWSIAWRVLDAQFWGVPQRRRRIFLVADFGGESAPEILFKREGLRRYTSESGEAGQGVAGDAERGAGTAIGCFQNTGQGWWNQSNIAQCIRTPCGGDGTKANLALVMAHGQANAEIAEDVCPTLNCNHEQPIVASYAIDEEKNGHTERYGTLEARRSGGGVQGCVKPYNSLAVRRLTPLECERLQGFPDGWTNIEKASDSARYKALGNSVAIPCVEYVLEGIAEVLNR